MIIKSSLLNDNAFWWAALDRQHNVSLLDKFRISAAIYMIAAQSATFTKALVAMLNWLPSASTKIKCCIYSMTIEPNLLNDNAFWWAALDKHHNASFSLNRRLSLL